MMATSSDETMGEVTSKSLKISQALRLKQKIISKKKDFSPNHHYLHQPPQQLVSLTENLRTWRRHRRLRFVRSRVDDTQSNLPKGPASVVKLRQCDSDQRRIERILLGLGRNMCELALKRSEMVYKGLDIYLDNERDAYAFFNRLCNLLPIRLTRLSVPAMSQCYITAMLCPISREDLIYLRPSNALAGLGSSGPLSICTMVTKSISLLNPFTLAETTFSAAEYWNEPTAFEIYKSGKDLVEYIVLDVTTISRGNLYSLADVDVARVADFGKNDIVFTTKTHLGHLKPGDHAFGYDLYGTNNNSTMMGDESKDSLPDVVLIKKKNDNKRPVSRKNISPEYEEFLRDLENNPEAMFSLSLNGDSNNKKAEKLQLGIDGIKEGKNTDSGFVLDRLLADLMLGDHEDVGATGTTDEQHR